jgi:ADP-ribose pyrophosphatase YjhB (NUDIX family)
MEYKKNIDLLETLIQNSSEGLPEEVFLFISRMTPLVNVDLLIKNEQNQTLLTWRDDGYWHPGWHVPGGIIRYKETIATRVKAVAKNEFGAEVEFEPAPLAMNELFHPTRRNRGHFISLLYQCRLITQPDENLRCRNNTPKPHEWMWHSFCPTNMISVHDIYRHYI